jgi:hypothetical protein
MWLMRHEKPRPRLTKAYPYPIWMPIDLRLEFDNMRKIKGVTRSMAEDHCRVLMRRRAANVSATPRLEAAE